MKVAIIGTGYVGTVAGACFAETGNQVVCVDADARKVAALSGGDPVIFEPGLEELLKRNLTAGRIRFTPSVKEAVDASEIIFMTVGTPPLPSGEADLGFLKSAAEELARHMTTPKIVVNKSTVPVGTHKRVLEWIRTQTETPCEVVSNPEFMREGAALQDFLFPERVVIGTRNELAFRKIAQLYSPFVRSSAQILRMDPISAELTKYACNAFLATRISFMNELAQLCELAGGDIESIRQGMSLDSRIGKHFLNAGIGYGGSCFPKDIRALLATAERHQMKLKIVSATEDINHAQKKHLIPAVREKLGTDLSGKKIAFWGIAFKPNTDDVREAPALVLMEELVQAGAAIHAFDPVAAANATLALSARTLRGVQFVNDRHAALSGVDALIIATEWEEFRRPDYPRMKAAMRRALIFDGRNSLSPTEALKAGFEYVGIGRGCFSTVDANLPEEAALTRSGSTALTA